MSKASPTDQFYAIVRAVREGKDASEIASMFFTSDFLSPTMSGKEIAFVAHAMYGIIKQVVSLENKLAQEETVTARYESILKNALRNGS